MPGSPPTPHQVCMRASSFRSGWPASLRDSPDSASRMTLQGRVHQPTLPQHSGARAGPRNNSGALATNDDWTPEPLTPLEPSYTIQQKPETLQESLPLTVYSDSLVQPKVSGTTVHRNSWKFCSSDMLYLQNPAINRKYLKIFKYLNNSHVDLMSYRQECKCI